MRILVLGGSFGGLTAAFELKRHLGKEHKVTLVSDNDKFVFIPSLPWLVMGWRKPEDITLEIRKPLESKGIEFVHSEAQRIDPESRKVYTAQRELTYDYLVIATGAHLDFKAIPGLDPKLGYTYSVFTLDYAIKANLAWESFLSDLGPLVLDAAQGGSCFGPAYELVYMIDSYLRKIKKRRLAPITFITSEPYLGHFGIGGLGKSRRRTEDEFLERDIKSITNCAIEEITKDRIKLKDGTALEHRFSMIVPPFMGVDVVVNSSLGNPKGFIPVDAHYRHQKYPDIYAIGVAIAIAPPEGTQVPIGVPKTGYMTEHMAKVAAKNIASAIKGEVKEEPSTLSVFCVLDAGNKATFMFASPVLPPRNKTFIKETRIAHWFKVFFQKYFLWKMRFGLTRLP